MAVLGSILGLLLVLGGPCAIAIWIGTRVRWTVVAFFLAWVMTPIVNIAMVLVLIPLAPSGGDGTWAIILPIYGIGTGLVSGIVAAVIVARRRTRDAKPPAVGGEPEATGIG